MDVKRIQFPKIYDEGWILLFWISVYVCGAWAYDSGSRSADKWYVRPHEGFLSEQSLYVCGKFI
jgi:hypothetical protein